MNRSNICDFYLSFEERLAWVVAIEKHKNDDHCASLFERLFQIAPRFKDEFIDFGRFLLKDRHENPERENTCFVKVNKSGFQLCRCFTVSKSTFEKSYDIAIPIVVENFLNWNWGFSAQDFADYINRVNLCLNPQDR